MAAEWLPAVCHALPPPFAIIYFADRPYTDQLWQCMTLTLNLTSACRLREQLAERKQGLQQQMSALYEDACSPLVSGGGNKEQCVSLLQQLTAALAA